MGAESVALEEESSSATLGSEVPAGWSSGRTLRGQSLAMVGCAAWVLLRADSGQQW